MGKRRLIVFDSVARIHIKKRRPWSKGEITLIVHEAFLNYLKDFVPNKRENEEVLQSLVKQQSERYDMQTNKSNPFYGDEAGFEHYCRVKYKKLCDHIDRMIEQLYQKSD